MDADNKKPVDAEKEPAAKGINWLTIFGWAVLAILVVIIIFVLAKYQETKDNPLVQAAAQAQPFIDEMKKSTRSQIEDQSEYVFASDVESIESAFNFYFRLNGRFVQVEGEISKDETENVAANVAGNVMSTSENYGAYVLNDNIVVIDIEKGYQNLAEGTTIVGCGKILLVRMQDIWDLPFVGEDLKQEFAGVEGMPEGVVFLISKEIKVRDEPTKGMEGDAPSVEAPVPPEAGDVEEPALLGPEGEDEPAADTEGEAGEAEDAEAAEDGGETGDTGEGESEG